VQKHRNTQPWTELLNQQQSSHRQTWLSKRFILPSSL